MQGQGNRTCLEQISLRAPGVTRAQVEAAADAVGATRFIRALPRGFDHDVLEEGKSLSSGQKQLLAFARAFLLDPGVVIMDEATASVDAESERVIETALDTLLHGRTAIIIAHRLSTIRSAQRILVLHHGRLVEAGTHAHLLAHDGVYAQIDDRLRKKAENGWTLSRLWVMGHLGGVPDV